MIFDEKLDRCPICDSADWSFYKTFRYGLERFPAMCYDKCENCQAVYLNPRMNEEQARKLYKDEYAKMGGRVLEIESKYKRDEVLNKMIMKATVTSHLDVVYSREEAVRISGCEKEIVAELNDAVSNENFDLITCIQVLHRINYPVQLVESMLKHLNPDGSLWIEVPNCDYEFEPNPWHVIMFTEDTLAYMIKRAGGKINRLFAYQGYHPENRPYYIMAEVKR